MATLNQVRSDLSKERRGVWCEYELGIKILIARSTHPEYQKAMRKALKAKRLERGSRVSVSDLLDEIFIDDQEVVSILAPPLAKHILLDWQNIEDDNGNLIPYSQEKALEILIDPELRDFFNFTLAQSSNQTLYRKEEQEESAKN